MLNDKIPLHEEEWFEKLAIKIGNSIEYTKSLKQRLVQNKNTMPLFNTHEFTKNIEEVYIKLYDNYYFGRNVNEEIYLKKALSLC